MRTKNIIALSFILVALFLVDGTIYSAQEGSESSVSVEPHASFLASDNDDNKMLAFGWFKNGFSLEDNTTTVSFESAYPVAGDVKFRGGKVFLQNNLIFANDAKLHTPGSIFANTCIVDFSQSVTGFPATYDSTFENLKMYINDDFKISNNVTFRGDCTINGRGNTIEICPGGSIQIDENSSLTFANLHLESLCHENLRCLADSASITLQNCHLEVARDYEFAKGSLSFEHEVFITGTNRFIYSTTQPSTVLSPGILFLGNNLTFSYAPASDSSNLLQFENKCSQLFLHGATLFSTSTGLQLTKGTIFVDQISSLKSDLRRDELSDAIISGGITFGDGIAENDCDLEILPASTLRLTHGQMVYKNVNAGSLKMLSSNSLIELEPETTLQVNEDMTLGRGRILMDSLAFLSKSTGKKVNGSLNRVNNS